MRSSRVYEPIYTVKNQYHDFIIMQDVFLPSKLWCFFTFFTWNLEPGVTIIDLSSPVEASLYNIGTRLCSQRTTSSSSKCREMIRWRWLFINNEYEEKQKSNKK